MKRLLFILLLSIPFASFGQQHVLFRDSTTIDSFRLTMWVRQLIPPAVPKINPFFDSLGSAYLAPNGVWWRHNGVVWQALTTDPDSAIWATNAYVDSGLASISAGAVDTNNYISSITRLNREIDSVSNIIDSNNTIIYGNIATLQSDIVTIDSALGVAFGAISNLYDTLPNYVDTAQLNDSLQVIKARDVPYTGATTDVNLGTHNILPNSVRLSASPTGTLTNVGQLYFDATNVTPAIPLNANVTLQIGQEEHIRARNNTGVQINDGQVVYINDAQGNNPTIALANADSVTTSEVVGIATENIAHNGTGFVTTFGIVNGINTSGYNDGDILYLSATNGTITNVIPSPPHNVVHIGVALNSTVNGKIFVHPADPIGQDTTFAAPYNSNKVAPTQRAIGTYARKIVKDTASALRTAINTKGTVTSIQLVGGTNVTITPTTAITTSGTYTISATGGSSTLIKANEFNMLYKANGDTTIRGTTKVRVDTTDSRMEFAFDTTTTTVTTDPHGGVKMWGSNRMGMGAVRINDTVSIPAALQRAINAQLTSTITGVGVGLNNFDRTGSFLTTSNVIFSYNVGSGTYAPAYSAYNATIQQFNYVRGVVKVAAGANQVFWIRVGNSAGTSGIICGNTKFSGGGGRGTFMFSLPTYAAGERMFVGYSTSNGVPSGDPSAFLNSIATLGLGKDAADTTLQFMYASAGSVIQKVNTGITPNNEDVYRVTVYVSPSSNYYIQLEVLNKNGTTVRVINPTAIVPAVGTKLVLLQYLNNAATGVQVEWGQILTMEEIY